MAVKIRLARHGRRKKPMYSIVVADARAPRDGKFIEKLGTYNPNTNPATISFNEDKAFDWVMKGAQPTNTVKAMLSYRGVMLKKHLQIGVLKGAISQEDADKKYEAWRADKDSKIEAKGESVEKAKAEARAKALEAETKKKEAREAELKARETEATAEAEGEEATEEAAEGAEATEAATEEAPAAEGGEEAPAEEKTEE